MARGRKSSNDPLAFLITAFLMIPFALAAMFKLLFKGISCLASFIGRCIEKRRIKQQTYTYNTSNSYHSQSRYSTESNSAASSNSYNSSNSTYKASDNVSNRTSQRSYDQSTSQKTEQHKSTYNSNTHSSLYESLRIPGDPDPDLTIPSAPDYESYDEYFNDPDDVFEEVEEIVPDEDEELFEALENLDIDESDLTIMGLALYDMLTNNDNN